MMNNLFYQKYIQDPGYGSLSPSRAASGFDKDNHWGLVYGGGLFAGIAMDLETRHRTGNEYSLDDVMREFYAEYGGSGQTIYQTDILEEVNKIGKTDFSAFMKSYILGTDVIGLAPYLKYAGIQADTSANELLLTHLQDKTALQSGIWAGFLGEQ
jgi:predicted metalloprotease with PDZ domain